LPSEAASDAGNGASATSAPSATSSAVDAGVAGSGCRPTFGASGSLCGCSSPLSATDLYSSASVGGAPGPSTASAVTAVDDQYAYFCDQTLSAIPKRGGAALSVSTTGCGYAVASDGKYVYWLSGSDASSANAVMRAHPDGTGRSTVFAQDRPSRGMTVHGGNAYVATEPDGASSIWSVGVDGGAPTLLASGEFTGVERIAADDANVYWVARDLRSGAALLMSVPVGGGAVTTLHRGGTDPRGIALDDARVYYAFSNELHSIGKDGSGDRVLSPIVNGMGFFAQRDIAVRGGQVYISEQCDGAYYVVRVPTAGGDRTIVSGAPTDASVPFLLDFAVDDGASYVMGAGQLQRFAW
jgi:hypothetical protein